MIGLKVPVVRWTSYLKKFKYVYHCQDIHPEAMVFSNTINKSWYQKILLKIDIDNINSAWKVITLSRDMKNTLEKRGCKTSHIHLINNFIFEKKGERGHQPLRNNQKVRFLFAGSIGRLQNLDTLMEGIVLLNHRDDIEFTFVGEGVMLDRLRKITIENNLKSISFLGQKSLKDTINIMHRSDIGIGR